MTSIEPKPRTVAYLTSQYPATSHTFILREVAALREAGVRVNTFTIRPADKEWMNDQSIASEAVSTYAILAQNWSQFAVSHLKLVVANPIRYVRVSVEALRHRPPGWRAFLLAIAHFVEAGVLANELSHQQITHLHNHFANSAATVGFLAAMLVDLPWSFTIHGISETDYPAGVTLPQKIRSAQFIACASWFGRAQAMRVVEPEHWFKIKVIRCGLRLNDLPSTGRVRSGRRILCVGRLSPEKGQAGLLDVFAAIHNKVPDVRLELIGTGSEEGALHRKVASLNLEHAVTFAGRRSEADTLAAIGLADILVVSSFMEGLPVVLMEAMALGTAVVAPRLAGIPELIDDDRTGLLFTPSNWHDLEAQLTRLVIDQDLRVRLAKYARETINDQFDIAQSAAILANSFSGERSRRTIASIIASDPSEPNSEAHL